MCSSEDGHKEVQVPATKVRIKFGRDCWVRTFQIKDPKKIEDELMGSKKKKRGAQDIEELVGTKKNSEVRWKKARETEFCAKLPKTVLKDGSVVLKPVKRQKNTDEVVTPKEIFEDGLKTSVVAQGSKTQAIKTDCSVRAAILKCQYAKTIIMRGKQKRDLEQQSSKVSIRQEKARIEAKRKAELKEMRDRDRAKKESMVIRKDLDEKYNFMKVHIDWVQLCGSSYMKTNLLPGLGLVLKNDDDDHLEGDDIEEGEIVKEESL